MEDVIKNRILNAIEFEKEELKIIMDHINLIEKIYILGAIDTDNF